jgi:hypothetical protein
MCMHCILSPRYCMLELKRHKKNAMQSHLNPVLDLGGLLHLGNITLQHSNCICPHTVLLHIDVQ